MNLGLRIRHILGLFFYYGFCQFLPGSSAPIVGKTFKRTRAFVLSMVFEKIGKSVNVEPRAKFGKGSKIIIGDFSGIGRNCRLPEKIHIGKFVMMAEDVIILNANHKFDRQDIPMCFQGESSRIESLVIEDDVWIGTRSIILPSVLKIGAGSIIGAGTIVTKDVPANAVVCGNPGKIVKYRF